MAVAVKNNRDASAAQLLDRLPGGVVAGVVYVLVSLGIVFPLLGWVWWLNGLTSTGWFLLQAAVALVLAVVLAVVGGRLLARKALPGLRAGVALGSAGVLLILLIAVWVGGYLDDALFAQGMGSWVGVGLTVALAVALLVLGGMYFFTPKTEKALVLLEDQGWFGTRAYKRSQGQRVRRGTILGILIVLGTGIWSLHLSLAKSGGDWVVNVPYTGKVLLTPATVGDNPALRQQVEARGGQDWVSRYDLRDVNQQFEKNYVKVAPAFPGQVVYENPFAQIPGMEPKEPELKELKVGDVIPKSELETQQALWEQLRANAEKQNLDASLVQQPKDAPVTAAAGQPVYYQGLVVLPAVTFTLPLLLCLATLWLAWRTVNVPAWADFFIATEAELNKVSWTTRRRLVQDTVVVLVTVVLMALALFVADNIWIFVMNRIGVLQPPPQTNKLEDVKW